MERDLCLDWQSLVDEAVKRRKSEKISQVKMAMLAGVSKPTVIHFEQGDTNITLSKAIKILKVVGLVIKPA